MARTLTEDMTDEQLTTRAKAVLEHHFDNHEHCGDWCRRKPQYVGPFTKAEHKAQKKKFYRHKERDTKLYTTLQQKLARFISIDALREVCHDMDTNVNESLNNTIAWLAPKNKVYSGTLSLSNRICIALCISSLGTMVFFQRVFDSFGINMTTNVRHYLELTSVRRAKRIARTKTAEGKKKRARKFHDKLIEHTLIAKKERKKRAATHKSGIGMDGGYNSSDDSSEDDANNRKPKARAASKNGADTDARDMTKFCKRCEEYGHCRSSSRLCKHFVPRKARNQFQSRQGDATPQQIQQERKAQTERDADECDVLDALPFDDDDASSAFFSAEEYSASSGSDSNAGEEEGRTGILVFQ